MGHRPNSYLGYGIAWEEGEHGDIDPHDVWGELSSHPEVQAEVWAHEETPCLFIYMGETFTRNDWDDVGVVDLDKMKIKPEYDSKLAKVCEDLGLKYNHPKFHLLSYYG